MDRVLIADDDAGIRRLLARVLSREGYTVATAGNGAEALDQIVREKPGLLLLDLHMPVMDGWEVYRRLEHEQIDSVEIIVLTAEDAIDEIRSGLPAADVLQKPFDLDQLLAKVAAHSVPARVEAPARRPLGRRPRLSALPMLLLAFVLTAVHLLPHHHPHALVPWLARGIWRSGIRLLSLPHRTGLRPLVWALHRLTARPNRLSRRPALPARAIP